MTPGPFLSRPEKQLGDHRLPAGRAYGPCFLLRRSIDRDCFALELHAMHAFDELRLSLGLPAEWRDVTAPDSAQREIARIHLKTNPKPELIRFDLSDFAAASQSVAGALGRFAAALADFHLNLARLNGGRAHA